MKPSDELYIVIYCEQCKKIIPLAHAQWFGPNRTRRCQSCGPFKKHGDDYRKLMTQVYPRYLRS